MRALLLLGFRPLMTGHMPRPEGGTAPALSVALDSYSKAHPLADDIRLYEASLSLRLKRTRRRGQSPTRPTRAEVRQVIPEVHTILGRTALHPDWASVEAEAFGDPAWLITTNVIAFYRWWVPLLTLLRIARDALGPIATTTLCQALVVEKSVLSLQWVQQRVEQAQEKDDQALLLHIGRAVATAAVPQALRKGALNFFLVMFDPWLGDLPLSQQVALLREDGVEISEGALRNRRSRLGIANADRERPVEFPPELEALVRSTQVQLESGLGDT
jgi:hypothetical protein